MGECWESFDISLPYVLAQDTLTDASASQFWVKLVFKVPYSAHFDFSVFIHVYQCCSRPPTETLRRCFLLKPFSQR